jgi:hypothetical protein
MATVVLACEGSSTLTCPTSAQTVTFSAVGSCSGAMGGTITVSTEPGLCTFVVTGADNVGLPSQGQFSGSASQTNYDLSKGNWYLSLTQGNAADGTVDNLCDSSVTPTGVIDLSCSYMSCGPTDCTGASCNDSDCVEHLTPM